MLCAEAEAQLALLISMRRGSASKQVGHGASRTTFEPRLRQHIADLLKPGFEN